MTHIWLRAESKEGEKRTPLTPKGAQTLLKRGLKVTVEKDEQRVFSIKQYQQVGCQIAPAHSWREAPHEAFILGLKELAQESFPLTGRHIYFAHAFKGQNEAPEILARFQQGAGELFDLEFLIDSHQRRVAAFGRWAGFVGAAIALDSFFHSKIENTSYPALKHYQSADQMIDILKEKKRTSQCAPRAMVIGALGRCGSGAVEVFERLALDVTQWDFQETKKGGPFLEILQHDIFVNTVLLNQEIPPFITKDILSADQKLKVIADVSCDPNNPHNPVPLYNSITSWERPFVQVADSPTPLEILAVDNLPSVLPKESSEDFAAQLLPHLLNLSQVKEDQVWLGALHYFEEAKRRELSS